jgi:hypothetical protein
MNYNMINSSPDNINLFGLTLVLVYLLSGCSHTSELYRIDTSHENAKVNYSVIYYIHADSDYLYHNVSGDPVRGNSQVLETAIGVAKTAESGEVFIFHHLPEKKILGLFPRNKSHFYHYVNGELSSQGKYRHSNRRETLLAAEARLYNQYHIHSGKEGLRKYFLYFGHEIPFDEGKKYHRTLKKVAVNTTTFSTGVQKFLVSGAQRFNLVVISSCNNGSPDMAYQLMPFSDVLLASPQEMHLSHIDSKNLRLMDINPEIPSVQLAHAMADQTFSRLESEIHTTITLTVFDLTVLQNYKSTFHNFLSSYSPGQAQAFSDNVDCKQYDFFNPEILTLGLRMWYKPARFGRHAPTNTHSGWGCKPLTAN